MVQYFARKPCSLDHFRQTAIGCCFQGGDVVISVVVVSKLIERYIICYAFERL